MAATSAALHAAWEWRRLRGVRLQTRTRSGRPIDLDSVLLIAAFVPQHIMNRRPRIPSPERREGRTLMIRTATRCLPRALPFEGCAVPRIDRDPRDHGRLWVSRPQGSEFD